MLKEEVMKKRCIHVITENERVLKAKKAISSSDFLALGELMLQTHISLSESYEVSTSEIDFLIKRSQQIDNIVGSRIMGGGFGGCTINLVEGILPEAEIEKLAEDYKAETGLILQWHEVKPGNGVTIIEG